MALFRTDFCGRGELAERQQRLGQMMALLKKVRSSCQTALTVWGDMGAGERVWMCTRQQ
jgi:meiotic recombination protein DMC1